MPDVYQLLPGGEGPPNASGPIPSCHQPPAVRLDGSGAPAGQEAESLSAEEGTARLDGVEVDHSASPAFDWGSIHSQFGYLT